MSKSIWEKSGISKKSGIWKKSDYVFYFVIYNAIILVLFMSLTGYQSEKYQKCENSNRTCTINEKLIMSPDEYVIERSYYVININNRREKTKYWAYNGERLLGKHFPCHYIDNKLTMFCDEYKDDDQHFEELKGVLAYIMLSMEVILALSVMLSAPYLFSEF